jgi:hypothetical protein
MDRTLRRAQGRTIAAARHAVRIALAVLLMGATAAPRARAAEALSLRWNDCWPDPGARENRVSPCNTNINEHLLFAAFEVGARVDSVLGMELVIDVQHGDPALPDWWRFDPDGCRFGFLRASIDFTAFSTCVDPWQGQGAASLQDYTPGMPRGGPAQARIRVAAALPPSAPERAFDPGSVYYAMRLGLSESRTVGEPSCPGCDGSACLVLNSIALRRTPGAIGGDAVLTTPGASDLNWARWQGAADALCGAVPVRRATWGRIKGQYR